MVADSADQPEKTLMCGIVGAVGRGAARGFLLRGLATLEYRGYDSAGLAFPGKNGIRRIATTERAAALRAPAKNISAKVGIGHTRWATHGAPTAQNAHPVVAGKIAVVHNGIIENHAALRAERAAAGCAFHTDTDTEVAACLLHAEFVKDGDLSAAMRRTIARLEGAFALAAVAAGHAEVVCARHGAPLLAGTGEDGVYLASDAQALAGAACRVVALEDGDCALLSADGVRIANGGGEVKRAWHSLPADAPVAAPGEHRHFMLKEIFEQPIAVAAAVRPFVGGARLSPGRFGRGAAEALRRAKNILIVACGTSYHAGMVAGYWMRSLGVSCRAEIASEYRHSADPHIGETLAVAVSQSGETADTLSAVRAAKKAGAKVLSLVNAPSSAIARESDFVVCAHAGPEIGVASTKCFTAQLSQLLLLSLAAAKARGGVAPQTETAILSQLRALPHLMRRALLLEKDICDWARDFSVAGSALYIGRCAHYPLALEGALKLKEISYLHAEGCAAGELKHGMLALVDDKMPVVGIAPSAGPAAKMASNLEEVAARRGRLYVLSGGGDAPSGARTIAVEEGGEWVSPIVYAVPLQLLAYHTALEKGTDIDKPRNLAKSVTVE